MKRHNAIDTVFYLLWILGMTLATLRDDVATTIFFGVLLLSADIRERRA